MDTVQTHLQKTAGKIKAESDRVLKDLDQVLTLEQQQASKKAVEKHTSDYNTVQASRDIDPQSTHGKRGHHYEVRETGLPDHQPDPIGRR